MNAPAMKVHPEYLAALALATHAPTPEMIRGAREAAGLSQAQACELADLGSLQRWSEYERGVARIDDVRWQFFLLRAGLHPTHRLTARRKVAA